MDEIIEKAKLDPIAAVMQKIEADPRPDLINLCFGYYQSESDRTPGFSVLDEVNLSAFEARKVELSIAGIQPFRTAIATMLTQDTSIKHDTMVLQTIGASGGLWLNFTLLLKPEQKQKIWFSNPGWGNHHDIARKAGFTSASYRYETDAEGALNFNAVLDDLAGVNADDIVVIQGCCHNPTGIDLSHEQLKILATLVAEKCAVLVIDFAYFGLHQGVQSDRQVVVTVSEILDEFYVVNSFSKNLGLYNERLGALTIFSRWPGRIIHLENEAKKIVRATFSMPPVMLARKTAVMLNDNRLREIWYQEIATLSATLDQRRKTLVQKLKSVGLKRIIQNPCSRGMFINLALSANDVTRIADESGIYLLPNGRVSIASLQLDEIDYLVSAIGRLYSDEVE